MWYFLSNSIISFRELTDGYAELHRVLRFITENEEVNKATATFFKLRRTKENELRIDCCPRAEQFDISKLIPPFRDLIENAQ